MKQQPPGVWVRLLSHLAEVDKRLAGELWQAMWPSEAHDVGFQISRILDSGTHPECVENFGKLVTPKFLMELCVRLAPETGKPRRKDVRLLEQAILRTSRNGEWC